MSKRQADQTDFPQAKAVAGGKSRHQTFDNNNDMGEFEDAWEDEIEEEFGDEGAMDDNMNQDGDGMDIDEANNEMKKTKKKISSYIYLVNH
ncbi:unnamed protein product [Cunninghamella echinulata]